MLVLPCGASVCTTRHSEIDSDLLLVRLVQRVVCRLVVVYHARHRAEELAREATTGVRTEDLNLKEVLVQRVQGVIARLAIMNLGFGRDTQPSVPFVREGQIRLAALVIGSGLFLTYPGLPLAFLFSLPTHLLSSVGQHLADDHTEQCGHCGHHSSDEWSPVGGRRHAYMIRYRQGWPAPTHCRFWPPSGPSRLPPTHPLGSGPAPVPPPRTDRELRQSRWRSRWRSARLRLGRRRAGWPSTPATYVRQEADLAIPESLIPRRRHST